MKLLNLPWEEELSRYNPSVYKYALQNPERCFEADTPTLVDLFKKYKTKQAPTEWLQVHLKSIIDLSGAKLEQQDAIFYMSYNLYQEFYFLKLSELLLFFAKFVCGLYGKFYGRAEMETVQKGLKTFVKDEHMPYIAKKEKEEEWKRREEQAKNAITPQRWCEMKGLPPMSTIAEITEYINSSQKQPTAAK